MLHELVHFLQLLQAGSVAVIGSRNINIIHQITWYFLLVDRARALLHYFSQSPKKGLSGYFSTRKKHLFDFGCINGFHAH